ncbi:hypothetical protein D3C85_991040 [compost metagenome]
MLDRFRRPGQAQGVRTVQQDAAADPQHGDGADGGQEREDARHALDQTAADGPAGLRGAFGHVKADVVQLHQQADRPIDRDCHGQADHDQHPRLGRQGRIRNVGQGDGHDLCGQDQVRAHGPGDCSLFQMSGVVADRLFFRLVTAEHLHHLFRPLETEIGAAAH